MILFVDYCILSYSRIIFAWCALTQVIPVRRFYEVVKNSGVGLTMASMGMTSFCDGPADGTNLTAVGEIRLLPDLTTKYRIPWYQFLILLSIFYYVNNFLVNLCGKYYWNRYSFIFLLTLKPTSAGSKNYWFSQWCHPKLVCHSMWILYWHWHACLLHAVRLCIVGYIYYSGAWSQLNLVGIWHDIMIMQWKFNFIMPFTILFAPKMILARNFTIHMRRW